MAAASVQRLLDPDGEEDEPKPKSPQLLRIELLRQMVINGVGPQEASLTSISGIGSKWARKLVAAGIKSLDHLAQAKTRDLTSLGKITDKRAEKWIRAARISDKSQGSESPHGKPVSVQPSNTDLGFDPYRLRRARELDVESLAPGSWQITGGLEPHIVSKVDDAYRCDCPDFAKGNTCKHILATRNAQSDTPVRQAMARIDEAMDGDFLDLTKLWFAR